MVGGDFHFGSCPEDKLLNLLQDTTQRLQGLLHSGRTMSAEGPRPELASEDSTRLLKKLFQLFKEWSLLHTHRVGFLREELSVTAHTLTEQEGKSNSAKRDTQAATQIGVSRESNLHEHAYITDVFLSVLEDVQNIETILHSVTSKVERAISILSDAKLDNQVLPQTASKDPCVPQETFLDYIPIISQESDLQNTPDTKAETYPMCNRTTGQFELSEPSKECRVTRGEDAQKEKDIQCEVVKSLRKDVHRGHQEADDGEIMKEPEVNEERGFAEMTDEGGRSLIQSDCVGRTQTLATVSLTDSGSSSSKPVCYITGPVKVAKLITCKVVDGLSSLMVSGSEELVSSVLRIENPSSTKCSFPLSIAMPFRACYRGNYREVTVKVVDQEQRVSYVSPTATEGNYEGHRGSFAVVRVYTLGVFAVVSRLQRETFTIIKRGLSVKLLMDSRICLDYLPGSFTTPVVAQAMVQPVDAMQLCTLKCRNDSYHSILTTSPLLYLNHPSTVTFRRPLIVTLPCPPNPDKRRIGEDSCHTRPDSIALMQDTFSPHQLRVLRASLKSSRELSREQLAVLGWRDEQWNVLDKISVRNLQNGLVSFELTENYERLMVIRLLSPVRPSYLVSFAQDLEELVRTCAVTIVLHTKRQDPSSAVLAALPSRELSWALTELRAQAYCGPPEPSTEFSMREGEQLLLKFSGNITSTGDQGTAIHTVTLHSQRRNWLHVKLKEQDPFGNYSSPHYKGTAILFRIPRDQLVWRGDRAVISEDYKLEEPVCKLSLTLPKTMKTLPRPMSAKVWRHDQAEPLCDELLTWLCSELSEEDAALLVMCLRLRRSTVQLARLRAPDSLSLQTFHILSTWRRALPSSTPKRPLLARCLIHIGRSELAAELLRRGPAVDEGERRRAEPWKLNTLKRPVTGHGTLRHSITLE
ncbi:death domain-containing protein 1 [Salminus brasiliensis]|uniref:death domain-containing protein 1 n=1 Tax=Salminus brasiliensis TaxID=930266 RepID=UPI003B8384E5